MSVFLIVNADDLGLAESVNRAVHRAHREGILTSATLMPNGPAFDHGVETARACPDLGVGIHLNAVRGQPVAPPAEVSTLLNSDGRFRYSSWSLGMNTRTPGFLQALEREYRAQIERVLAAGIAPTHLDSEKHHAVWRSVQELIAALASEYGIPAMRNLREPAWLSWRALPRARFGTLLEAMLMRAYVTLFAPRVFLPRPDYFFGQTHIGQMTESAWQALASILPDGVVEVMVHPGEDDEADLAQTASAMGESWIDRARPVELAALLSPDVRQSLDNRGVSLVSYRHLAGTAS